MDPFDEYNDIIVDHITLGASRIGMDMLLHTTFEDVLATGREFDVCYFDTTRKVLGSLLVDFMGSRIVEFVTFWKYERFFYKKDVCTEINDKPSEEKQNV